MKKLKIVLLLPLILLMTGCNKDSYTTKSFRELMKEKGYELVEVDQEYEDVENATVAKKNGIEINFFNFKTVETAKLFYSDSKNEIENNKEERDISEEKSKDNYSKYTISTGGIYYVVSRIDDTVIYMETEDSKVKEVDEALESIGY